MISPNSKGSPLYYSCTNYKAPVKRIYVTEKYWSQSKSPQISPVTQDRGDMLVGSLKRTTKLKAFKEEARVSPTTLR
jgi:hypothetical protein